MRSVGPRENDPAKFAASLNRLTRNRWGEVTLSSTGSTTINDPTLTPASLITFDPLTEEAREAYPPLVLRENRLRGRFIITHASGLANCSYRWKADGD